MNDRSQPASLDAEASVLGAIIATGGRALDEIADRLDPSEFFRQAHRDIYRSMRDLYTRGEPVDPITLKHQLQRDGLLEDVGGVSYVSSLDNGIPRSTNVKYYASIVREKASKRQIIALANRLLSKAYEDDDDPVALVNMAEQGLLDISHHAVPGDLVPSSDIVKRLIPVIERLRESKHSVTGIATGFRRLDYYTRGLQPGNLVILAGRTSHGKSTVANQIALHVAQSSNVAFFSVEMSEEEAGFRSVATLAQVDGHLLQSGQLDMHQMEDVGRALQEFSDSKFQLDESSTLSALQIRSRARRMQAKKGLGLIVVDYLQILQHPKGDSQEQRVAATSRMLKSVARELKVPVLALCQLSRAMEKRQDERPRLSDLRESGALEQDADVVLFIYRPEPKTNGMVTETANPELIIAKQRNGPKTTIEMRWVSEQYRFEETERAS